MPGRRGIDSAPVAITVEAGVKADPCHRLLTSFLGIPAGQVWADFYLWELLLNAHPEMRMVVEIGTWQGGFARYLKAQADGRGLGFVTFDVISPDEPPDGFVQVDAFASPELIWEQFEEPMVLLCDGGNKPRELQTFAPMLHEGSLVVVHDWLTEVQPDDIPDCLVEVYGDFCDSLGSMSRIFEIAA